MRCTTGVTANRQPRCWRFVVFTQLPVPAASAERFHQPTQPNDEVLEGADQVASFVDGVRQGCEAERHRVHRGNELG